MTNKQKGKGGKRTGAGRKPTGSKETKGITIRIDPKLKDLVRKRSKGNMTNYLVQLIKKDLKQ